MEAGESLRYRVLAGGGPILLDFDGPICSIFATYPAPAVADRLRAVLQAHGARVNGAAVSDPDPLEVLRWSATLGSDSIVRSVEDALREAEIHAASGADPTPFSRETILAAYRAGRLVGIASNNSADAIERYLTSQRLRSYVGPVIGRAPYVPQKMKPDPSSILAALSAAGGAASAAVYVGDSLTDIAAAHAAGMPVVAYANRPGKAERFTEARADAVVASMGEIATALAARG